jgi:putative FmdB family regulatory protein
MPFYEYMCPDCMTRFDKRRSISQRDNLAQCPNCRSMNGTRRVSLPMVFSRVEGGQVQMVGGGGSSCAGCAASSCAGCSS